MVNKAPPGVGVDADGIKHELGTWVQSNEGAKFWLHVLTELCNRGGKDVLVACHAGLEGPPVAGRFTLRASPVRRNLVSSEGRGATALYEQLAVDGLVVHPRTAPLC